MKGIDGVLARLGVGIAVVLVYWVHIIGGATTAMAQVPDPSDQVHAIAKLLNCPTCGGRNLADCPTDTCTQWKQEIRAQLDAGKTDTQIIDYFKTRFGPTVLQEPPKEGVILLLWVTPVVILILVLAAGVVVLKRITSTRTPGAPTTKPGVQAQDSYVARIEEEASRP